AEDVADALVAEADAQDGLLPGESLDQVVADPRLRRVARPGRDHEMAELALLRLLDRDRVVADDRELAAELAEVLREVIGERIVVVDEEHLPHKPSSAMATARLSTSILLHVSVHSNCGSLSATMPAPACRWALRPLTIIVRIVMQVSMSPVREK